MTHCLRGTLAGLLACLVVPAFAQSATPDLSGRDPHWIKDSAKNCWAADPDPQAGETVTWSGGACAGSLVNGQGTLTWYLNGRLFGRDEGTFKNGELFGHGRVTRANGASFEGEFPGKGVITLANGQKVEAVSIKEAVGWSIEQAPPAAR